MERNVNESFADYKVRRATSNLAVKNINAASKGGSGNNRANRMGKGGQYGRNLTAHFTEVQLAALRRRRLMAS